MWEGERKWIFPGRGLDFQTSKNWQQQPRPNKEIPPREGGNKAGPSKGKSLKGGGYSYSGTVHIPKPGKRVSCKL